MIYLINEICKRRSRTDNDLQTVDLTTTRQVTRMGNCRSRHVGETKIAIFVLLCLTLELIKISYSRCAKEPRLDYFRHVTASK